MEKLPHDVGVSRPLNYVPYVTGSKKKKRVKKSMYRPGQALGFLGVQNPRFQDSWYMKVVRLSALSTGRLYPHRKNSWYPFLLKVGRIM